MRANYKNQTLSKNSFKNASFYRAEMVMSNIKGCDFFEADLTKSTIKACDFNKNRMDHAKLNQTSFISTQLTDIVFEGKIEDCSFENCSFTRVIFQHSTLINTFFNAKTLKRVKFEHCFADPITYAFLKNAKADLSNITILNC